MLTRREKDVLRRYWLATHSKVRITKDGEVHAKKFISSPWGLLETARSAKGSAMVLLAKESVTRDELTSLEKAERAYNEDMRRKPAYHDGTPRKTWAQLGYHERMTWVKNPTPRDWS